MFALDHINGRLTQKATGKTLVVQGSTIGWGAAANDANQLWRHQDAGDGYYFLFASTGSVLDGNGSQIYLHPFNNGDYQRWRYEDAGDGYFKLVQKATGNVIDGNGSAIYMLPWNNGDYQRWALSVAPQLDRSKKYNEVTFAMAHDSHTGTKYYSDDDSVPENVDQTQPVSGQLRGGIRVVRISTGIWTDHGGPGTGTVILQHGDPNKFFRHLGKLSPPVIFGTLTDYLTQVRDFLNAPENRNEVVTIYDEGDSDGKLDDSTFEAEVAAAYTAVFGTIYSPAEWSEDIDLPKGVTMPIQSPYLQLTIHNILKAGKFFTDDQLRQLTTYQQQSQALVQVLAQHSNQPADFYNGQTNEQLIGMGAVLVYLRALGIRDDAGLRTMSADDQRNTFIVVLQGRTGLPVPYLQAMDNRSLATLAGNMAVQPGGGSDGSGVKVYIPSWDGNGNIIWPTLQEMVDKNQRLLVFRKSGAYDGNRPWILKAFANESGGEKDLIATNPSQFYGQDDRRPAWLVVGAGTSAWVPTTEDTDDEVKRTMSGYGQQVIDIETSCAQPSDWEQFRARGEDAINRGYGTLDANNLLLFHHFFYETMHNGVPIVMRDESVRAFSKWTVGDLLIEDTLRAWAANNHKPNFIGVDFYQGVKGATSYLLPLVDAMNRSGVSAPTDVVNHMGVVRVQDAGGVQMHLSYLIQPAATNDGCYLVVEGGSVCLGQTPQAWKLVYNFPAHGIALVNLATGLKLSVSDNNQNAVPVAYDDHAVAGDNASGFELLFLPDDNRWVIRRSLDDSANLTVRGRSSNVQVGDIVGTESWHDGTPAQKWVFAQAVGM